MKQNVQFQVGIYHEKFQHDKIKNGRLAAIFDRQIFSYKDCPRAERVNTICSKL